MDEDGIKGSLASAIAYLAKHPDEAAYTDSPAVARIEQGLRCRIDGPNRESLYTDMPASVGGGGGAPSAGWLFRAALAGCVVTLIAMRAAQESVSLGDLEVTVDSESDDRGILGIDESVPAGPLSIRLAISIGAGRDTPPDRLEEIARWGVAHCPVSEAAGRVVPVRLEIEAG
jgi:uncharacterized OsmC-like protein